MTGDFGCCTRSQKRLSAAAIGDHRGEIDATTISTFDIAAKHRRGSKLFAA